MIDDSEDFMHVFCFAGADKVVAADVDDAWNIVAAYLGEDPRHDDYVDMAPLADDHVLKIRDEDTDVVTAMTCREWVARNGRGFLCSNEI